MNIDIDDTIMTNQVRKNSYDDSNNYDRSYTNELTNIYENGITNDSQKPSIQDRVKLVYIDDEYAGLTQGICGTITSISSIKEAFKHDNRQEYIIWVEWDNGIKLGLIEGVDKYEIISEARIAQICDSIDDKGSNMIINSTINK
jgi:hypothetical protein